MQKGQLRDPFLHPIETTGLGMMGNANVRDTHWLLVGTVGIQ